MKMEIFGFFMQKIYNKDSYKVREILVTKLDQQTHLINHKINYWTK